MRQQMHGTKTPFFDMSSAIANHPHLELVLALAAIGWIGTHLFLRHRNKRARQGPKQARTA